MKILKELISLHGKGKSTCSPEVSLVNHLASLDNERERMMTVISGRKCLESYERQDRSGLLARMLLESPIWFNPVVKLTWKRKVIKMKKITRKRYLSKNISSIPSATILNVKDIPSNRSLFQLAVSERHINGIGYGSLLPTVQTQGLKVCDKDGKTRFMDLSSLPKQGIKYGDLLPTPVASDHTGSCPKGIWDMKLKLYVFEAIKNYAPDDILIISNQGGIEKGFVDKEMFEYKFDYISSALEDYTNISVYNFYCDNNDKDNINRKPNTGMIDQYMDYIKFINDNVDEENKIIYDTIMMIGDASGKEGQFSDSDKKTAENFGCEYMDVDDFVYKYNNR